MLSYQHGYHAGNFADVIKHGTLSRLLAYMTQKDKPLFYLETHSGKGQYDLYDKQAEKTGEYKEGIKLIWSDKKRLNPLFKEYIQSIEELNPTNTLRYYPGSPAIAIKALRALDRLYLCELHPREYQVLKQLPHHDKKVHFSNSDGIHNLKSCLPPLEKRGLIFIDPAYEVKEEYKTIPEAIKNAFQRFSTGVYCLWYPVVNRRLTDQLLRRMNDIGAKNTLHVEFNLSSTYMEGMSGCGLWIINPPFTLAKELETLLNSLKNYFNPGNSSYIVKTN